MTSPDEKTRVTIDAELKELIPRFIQLRHEDIQAIKEALDEGDYETISRLGHTMKGSGISYGFDYISEIGKQMEHAAKSQERDGVNKCLLKLSNYLENIEITFE